MNSLWVYAKIYDDNVCEKIISVVKKRNFSWGLTVDNKEQSRKNKIAWVKKDDAELNFLFNDMWALIGNVNAEHFRVNILELPEIQIAEYHSKYNGFYDTHPDVDFLSHNQHNGYQRKISFTIQLSNSKNYDGGDFYFSDDNMMHPNYDEVRQQGTVLLFPSFLPHGVKKVTRGVRYSIVGWFEGPGWC